MKPLLRWNKTEDDTKRLRQALLWMVYLVAMVFAIWASAKGVR
jgi:hypothetical protein